MEISERDRHQFYETARHRLGEAEADFLMAMLPPVGWADVATKHDLARLEAKIDAQLWKLIAANIASMVGLISVLLGAGAIA